MSKNPLYCVKVLIILLMHELARLVWVISGLVYMRYCKLSTILLYTEVFAGLSWASCRLCFCVSGVSGGFTALAMAISGFLRSSVAYLLWFRWITPSKYVTSIPRKNWRGPRSFHVILLSKCISYFLNMNKEVSCSHYIIYIHKK